MGDASKKKEYFWGMFVRKKKNRSGTTSVVVVDKSGKHFRELRTIGVSDKEKEIEELYQQGKRWLSDYLGERDVFAEHTLEQEEKQVTERLLGHIENILLNGTQLILNRVFQLVGFDKIDDELLKHLVVSRICQPRSKVATVDYLKPYFDEDIELHKIYRYLDRLHDTQKDSVQQISVEHTRRILGGKIGLVFYDVTTLYFETDSADDLRKTGFSKDGKHACPQIVLGLLASSGGYPLAYSIHEGNKYEGHTMLPVVEDFVKKFRLKDFVAIADSGLMNNDNIELLEQKKYKYIIGARIKNENKSVTQWILSLEKEDGKLCEYRKTATSRLIVAYSENRAKKGRNNREKGIKRLEKEYKSGLITKDKVNKSGYNKFLEISDDIKASINYDKIREDERWAA